MSDYLDNLNKKMKLALQLVSGYASEFQSWRLPESYERAYTDIDFYVEMAKTAEQGKIHPLFIADTPAMVGACVNLWKKLCRFYKNEGFIIWIMKAIR